MFCAKNLWVIDSLVIAVGSVGSNGDQSSFSSIGPWVDVSSYGEDIFSTMAGFSNGLPVTNMYGTGSGTSMASPQVAGLLGLMLSFDPSASLEDIMNCLISTANDVYDPVNNPNNIPGTLGTGSINAYDALRCLGYCADPLAVIFQSAQTICQNGSVTLTANTGTGYLWSTGSTSQGIIADQPGMYSVTVTFSGGCTASTSIDLQPSPTEAMILINETSGPVANDGLLCGGGSITGVLHLSAHWGNEYLWDSGSTSPGHSIIPNSGLLPLTATYMVTVTDVWGCTGVVDDAEVTVTWFDLPDGQIVIDEDSGVSDDGVICEGEVATLSVPNVAGNIYEWSTGESTSSILVFPSASTSYSVTVTDPNGCTAGSEVQIEVLSISNPFIFVGESSGLPNDGIFCEASSSAELLAVTPGTDYLWSSGETSQNIFVTFTQPETYSVTISNGNECTVTASYTVTVFDPPADIQISESSGMPNDGIICEGESVDLVGLFDINTIIYSWSTGETTPLVTVSPPATSTYSLTVTDIGFCTNESSVEIVVEECTLPFSCPCPLGVTDIGTPGEPTDLSSVVGIGSTLSGCVAIAGELTIDQDLTIENAQIKMQPGSSIIVDGAKFKIDNSAMFSCGEMWQGITVTGTGELETNTTNISFAIYAVKPLTGAMLNMTNTVFSSNLIGLHALDASFSLNSFGDNTFDGFTPLLPPLDGKFAEAGIKVEGGGLLNIGAGQPTNIFRNLNNGILSKNKSVRVYNAEFENIKKQGTLDDYEYMGYGVHAEGNSEVVWVVSNEFTDCETVVETDGVATFVSSNVITEALYGVRAKNAPNKNINIKNNIIAAEGQGISLENTDASYVRITDNQIDITYLSGASPIMPSDAKAISIVENGMPHPYSLIEENICNITDANAGIGLHDANGYQLQCNTVNASSGGLLNYSGIYMEKCKKLRLAVNDVVGNYDGTSGAIAEDPAGLRVVNTIGSIYRCNSIESTELGVQFDMNCGKTQFVTNNFEDHGIGLHYLALANTGKQPVEATGGQPQDPAHQNKWFGDWNGAIGARHESTNPNMHIQSRYLVPDDVLPVYPENVQPISGWFNILENIGTMQYCSLPCFEVCCKSPGKPANLEESIADGTFVSDGYEDEMTWVAERYLYRLLREDIVQIESGSIFESFYNANINSTIGRFTEIDEAVEELFVLDETEAEQLDTLFDQQLMKMDTISVIDSSLAIATGQEWVDLTNERAVQSALLEALSQSYKSVLQGVLVDRISGVGNILYLNSSVNVVAAYEQNEKTVNDIFLRSVVQGTPITALQSVTLEGIAAQCPYTGGTAVFRARNLLKGKTNQEFSNSVACSGGQQLIGQPSINASDKTINSIEMYPNPTDGLFNLKLNQKEEAIREIQVVDVYGKTVLKTTLTENQASMVVDAKQFGPGIYFVKVMEEGDVVFTERLVVQ